MPVLKETVRRAMQAQAPQLYRQLERSGKLASFVKEQADALNAEIHDAVMQRMMEPDMQALPDLERPMVQPSRREMSRSCRAPRGRPRRHAKPLTGSAVTV